MFIYFVKRKKQKQSSNNKIDDRVHVRNSKLVKRDDPSQHGVKGNSLSTGDFALAPH